MRSEPEITNYALRGLLSVEYLITTPEKRESFEDEADAGWTYLADVDGYTLYHNDNYVPMGFTYDYYVTKATYEASVKTLRSNLLLRALVLEDEDVKAYGQYLTELPDAMLDDLHYDSYTQDCADRRAHSCSVFQMNNAGSMPRSRWKNKTSSFSPCPTMTALPPMSTAKRPTSCVWTRD